MGYQEIKISLLLLYIHQMFSLTTQRDWLTKGVYCSGELLRADVHLYKILGYIALFRLEELTFPQFR